MPSDKPPNNQDLHCNAPDPEDGVEKCNDGVHRGSVSEGLTRSLKSRDDHKAICVTEEPPGLKVRFGATALEAVPSLNQNEASVSETRATTWNTKAPLSA
jgi:hypothetical protein